MEVIVNKSTNLALLMATTLVMASCASYDKAVESQKVVYKKAEKRDVGLDVPPDLTAQQPDDQFSIPGDSGTTNDVTASSYYSQNNRAGAVAVSSQPVLVTTDDIKIEQVGNTRSLLLKNIPPEKLWPTLEGFWTKQGFELVTNDPKIGVMQTDWKENRAAIPMDGVRKVLGKFIDGIYSSNQRDRYLTRVERTSNGGSEVFITHRGMEETYTDKSQTELKWVPRKPDPELEAIMTNRLLVKLTGDEEAAKKTGVETSKPLISVQKDASKGPLIVLNEAFPEAWRRIGVGLDRSGFIVEDRDRENGTYYVRYAPDSAAGSDKEPGFFGKLFGQSNDSLTSGKRFQVLVQAKPDNTCTARFVSDKGADVPVKLADQAVGKLAPQLQ